MTGYPVTTATADAGSVGVRDIPRIGPRGDIAVGRIDSTASDRDVPKAGRVSTAAKPANEDRYHGGFTRRFVDHFRRNRAVRY